MQKSGVGRRIGAFFLDVLIFTFGAGIILSLFEDPAYIQQQVDLQNAYMNGTIDLLQYTEALNNLVDPNIGLKLSGIFSVPFNIVMKEKPIAPNIPPLKVWSIVSQWGTVW